MKLLGTIDEWIEHNPKACLTNKKFLQQGVMVYDFKKSKNPQQWTYPTRRAGGKDPMIYFGNCCPYIETGYFYYSCGVEYMFSAQGCSYPLSDEMANDPNWEEYGYDHYLKGL